MNDPLSLNDTHDPARRSWVESANRPGAEFPIQNLPFAQFRRRGANAFRGGVAIGDQILDLAALHELRLLGGSAGEALEAAAGSTLNAFMAMGYEAWSLLRKGLSDLLSQRANGSQGAKSLQSLLVPQAEAEFAL